MNEDSIDYFSPLFSTEFTQQRNLPVVLHCKTELLRLTLMIHGYVYISIEVCTFINGF